MATRIKTEETDGECHQTELQQTEPDDNLAVSGQLNRTESPRKRRRNNCYTLSFKVDAINFFKQGNSKEFTARKYGVDSKQIREWIKMEDKILTALTKQSSGDQTERCRLDGAGRKATSEKTEHNETDQCSQFSADDGQSDHNNIQCGRRHKRYTLEFKLSAIAFHKKGHSKEFTARTYGIDSKRIREWLKHEEKLSNAQNKAPQSTSLEDSGHDGASAVTIKTEADESIQDKSNECSTSCNSASETIPCPEKRTCKSYTIAFKVSAVGFHKQGNSKELTAKLYGVDSKRIRDWVKVEDKLLEALEKQITESRGEKRRLEGGGRKSSSQVKTEKEASGTSDSSPCMALPDASSDNKRDHKKSAKSESSHKGRKLRSYTVPYKLSAIAFHKKGHSKELTAKIYGVDSKRIREWVKIEDKLVKALEVQTHGAVLTNVQRRRLVGGGRKAKCEKLESLLLKWLKEQHSKKKKVTRKMVQEKAIELFNSNRTTVFKSDSVEFTASRGWLCGFFRRNNIKVRKNLKNL